MCSQEYIEAHPDCLMVDPLDGIRKLLDRNEQYNLVLDCNTINTGGSVQYMVREGCDGWVSTACRPVAGNKWKQPSQNETVTWQSSHVCYFKKDQ